MTTHPYPWKRFWFARMAGPAPWGDGLLPDPEGPLGPYMQPRPATLADLLEAPCLALLGEAGMGKTRWLDAAWPEIEAAVAASGDRPLRLNLGEYGDEGRLVDDLFGVNGLGGWDPTKQVLHLYLDSLDECQLRIGQLTTLLSTRLMKLPADRLRLRIISRSADWPAPFEDRLRGHWGRTAVSAYELAPLREVDVASVAEVHGLDPTAFLSEIRDRDVVGFARKPVTLEFLLREYAERRELPQSRRQLYLRGCRHLCQETPTRVEANLPARFEVDQLFSAAARVAAAAVFSGRPLVWEDPAADQGGDFDVLVSDLVGGTEPAVGSDVAITGALIAAALRTGLFSPRGEGRFAWAHQSYAAFLAAWYIVEHGLELGQIRDLLLHPDGRVTPQLRDTAAWLASLDRRTFAVILAAEPELLARADLQSLTEEDRAAATDALLQACDTGNLVEQPWDLRADYRVLNHSGLAAQLRPYLLDRSRDVLTRRLAIEIAEACRLRDVQHDVVDLTLDATEPITLRVRAALALAALGDDAARARLRPLMFTGPEDPDDELKGATLWALWPTAITVDELFAALTPARNSGLLGNYGMLTGRILSRLSEADLPTALRCTSQLPADNYLLDELVREIFDLAWEHIRNPAVLTPSPTWC